MRFDFFNWLRTGPRIITFPIVLVLLAIGIPVFYLALKFFPKKFK